MKNAKSEDYAAAICDLWGFRCDFKEGVHDRNTEVESF